MAEGKIIVVLQIAPTPNPKIPNVPSLLDLVSAEDRPVLELMVSAHPMGRPFVAPPEVPADRVATLRAAFDATMKDPGLIADAQKQNLDLLPVTGAEMAAIIAKAYRTPEAVVAKAKVLVGGQ
jgi:hypothetical protein